MFNLKEIKSSNFYYNSLFYDFIFNFDKLKPCYFYDYRNEDEFKRRAEDIDDLYDNNYRLKIVNILKSLNSRLSCSQETLSNIDLLKDKKTYVVIGGQQPGFFTGPIFIIYKILTIIKLSHFLSKFLNCKVVPLFWNASDDSNFEQIDNFYLLNREIKKINLSLNKTSWVENKKRFSNILIPEELIKQKIIEVKNCLSPFTDFTEKIIALFEISLKLAKLNFSNKKGSISLSSFFSVLVTKLFSKYGLVIIDPSELDLKKMAFDMVKFDISNHEKINSIVRNSGENLKSQGYHSQLLADENKLNFFMDVDGERKRFVKSSFDSFILSDKSFNQEELFKLLKNRISDISLNVILRPVFQDMILPVLAEICGPGEVSYYAQLKKVYEIFSLKTGIVYPRFSATIIEAKVEKSIKKLGIDYEEIGEEKGKIRNKIISGSMGKGFDELINGFERDIFIRLNELKKSIKISAFDRIERNLRKEIKVLRKKIDSEFEKSSGVVSENLNKIYMNIFPENKFQERIINIFSFINKYDFRLIDSIYNLIEPFDFYHKFIVINS